ncbi:hypothetical protein KKP04_04585 [Rhodomicrobium sp. Az07]|uniref:hypothetical protein n=1 Tax=Rhodomicrobium sp. Az07 TaxID=2839034 RepID=UPI001BEAC338|nr:hypothetical protein [Rhodomicrobium sp. Az07]MBT3070145.1 hypothetical protein [Rhodomicrobium sp. Az07]
MIGGLVSRTSLACATTLGFALIFWPLSALAADTGSKSKSALGGDCCADLEERVAELELTTVRKGNRKVSLELSGWVDKILLFWNDGKQSDIYVADNNFASTRFRMKGVGQMAPDWKAGFLMEYEFRDSSSNLVDQLTEQNRNIETALRIRQENFFIENATFGRVTLGMQNTATKDLTLINLGGGFSNTENYHATSFYIRDNTLPTSSWFNTTTNTFVTTGPTSGALPNSTRTVAPTITSTNNTITVTGPGGEVSTGTNTVRTIAAYSVGGLVWNNLSNALDSQRQEVIRYDSPIICGFIASFAWGQNDFWDAALRYQKEFDTIRVAGGVGYQWWGERSLTQGAPWAANAIFFGSDQTNQPNTAAGPSGGVASSQLISNSSNSFGGTRYRVNSRIEVVEGNLSAMHLPTGLYGTIVGGIRHIENSPVEALNQDAAYWYTQVGITKRIFEVGASTIYAEYGNFDDFGSVAVYFQIWNAENGNTLSTTRIRDSNVDRFGIGVTQAFDGAAMEIYGNYLHFNANITTSTSYVTSATGAPATTGFNNTERRAPEDWDAFYTGARLKF